MYRVELYAAVRRSVYVEGLSERAAAAPLRVGPRDGAQDAALPPAARVSPGATGPASEAGRLHGDH